MVLPISSCAYRRDYTVILMTHHGYNIHVHTFVPAQISRRSSGRRRNEIMPLKLQMSKMTSVERKAATCTVQGIVLVWYRSLTALVWRFDIFDIDNSILLVTITLPCSKNTCCTWFSNRMDFWIWPQHYNPFKKSDIEPALVASAVPLHTPRNTMFMRKILSIYCDAINCWVTSTELTPLHRISTGHSTRQG